MPAASPLAGYHRCACHRRQACSAALSQLSSDPEQEYFTDGVTDDLATDPSRIAGALVIARSTAFTYKGKPVDIKQSAASLACVMS